MQIVFLKKFSKDLDKIQQPRDKKAILELIHNIQNIDSITELPNVKKLTGFSDAYRIRIKTLRIGIFITENQVEFARVAYRKDIYKVSP